MRGILGLGVSDGRFIHQLPDPRTYLHEGRDGLSPDVIRVEREETRVDVALGADFFGAPAAAVTIFAQGYAVLNSSCVDCDDVARYSQGWGASPGRAHQKLINFDHLANDGDRADLM